MTIKHIVFVSSSFEYTQGILPFTRRLETHGYIVNWISFRGYERRWLLEQGVSNERILDTLAGLEDTMTIEEIGSHLARLEDGKVPYINHIVSMDRLLRLKSDTFSRSYLAHIEKIVTQFLLERGVMLVLGGRDTALQISTSKICGRLGISYIAPTMTRIPDDRYGFCQGYTEASFVVFREPSSDDRVKAVEFLQHFRENKPVPTTVDFERRNNQFFRRLPSDIRQIITMTYRGLFDRGNDFTRYSVRQLFGMYWRRRWNSLCVRLAPPFQRQGSKPFVLYAYQMQPESSIDVLAAHYSDQITLIRQIARSVPSSHDFYVKPHPDHVGGLSRAKLDEIARIPGVTLVDPFASGRDLMHRAALIVTPTGTMAYEAALHGSPSIIFAKEFYGCLPTVHHCQSIDVLPELVGDLLSKPPNLNDQAILESKYKLFWALHRHRTYKHGVCIYSTLRHALSEEIRTSVLNIQWSSCFNVVLCTDVQNVHGVLGGNCAQIK